MTTRRIFVVLTLTAIAVIQASTAQAQSNTRGAILTQDKELKVSPLEDTCSSPLLQPRLTGECPKATAPQLKGSWLITFNPVSGDAPLAFASLATFTSDGGVINTAAGVTIDGVAINTSAKSANVHCPANTRCNGCAPGCYLPGSAGPGMGEWVTAQNHEFAITYVHLLYDGLGQYAGTVKVRAALKIYREASDQIFGRYVNELFNSDGEKIQTISGTVAGQRLFVESLPPIQ